MRRFFAECAKALCAFLYYLFMQLVVPLGMTALASLCFLALAGDKNAAVLPEFCTRFLQEHTNLTLFFCGAYTLVLLYGFFAARGIRVRDALNLRPIGFWRAALFLCVGVMLNVLVGFLFSVLPIPEELLSDYQQQSAFLSAESFPVRFMTIVLAAPLLEETIFRGLIQTHLQRAMGVFAAALIQSLVFGLLHGTLLWAAYGFAVGLICTFVSQKNDSLYASVALHMGFNLLGALA